jgi:hypothetical protein
METTTPWEEEISLNPFQFNAVLLPAKVKVHIAGRAAGKSFSNGYELYDNIKVLPRGITTITQKTYGQALTKTLPSTFKLLERFGIIPFNFKTRRGDYVVCRKPPEGFISPYERLLSFDNAISFVNGHVAVLLSQDTNSRGPNADFNITDEALTLDKGKFDAEVAPTNRGNEDIFGRLSASPVLKHHGLLFTSSMPYTASQKWLMDYSKYYEEEAGIRIFDTWNRIVKLQMQLIEAADKKDIRLFKDIWAETILLRKKISPFISRNGVLFTLGNAFDNLNSLGMSYILGQYRTMDLLTFMVEIMNLYLDKVDGCYYSIDERHVYYNATNDDYIRGLVDEGNSENKFEWDKLTNPDCRADTDCNLREPLEVTPDWGSKIALIEVAQERNFDFVTKTIRKCDNNINEFFVKPQEEEAVMIDALIDKFCDYYASHVSKRVIFYRDKYGDHRLANNKKTYNQHAIDRLIARGWVVEQRAHAGMEPPQHDKYLLWAYMLKEGDSRYPAKRFNGNKCKYTLISMNNTRVIEGSDGKFKKDKSSERRKSVLPEEATHFSDAVDKRIWTKYNHLLKRSYGFVAPRF